MFMEKHVEEASSRFIGLVRSKLSRLVSGRCTLLYPMSDPSYANRQCRHDTWTSMDLWTKDFLWKGCTIFELKNPLAEKETDSKQEAVGASSMQGPQQSVHVGSGLPETSYAFAGVAHAPPMYGPTSYLQDPTSFTVTVNVNVAGGATTSSSSVPQKQTELQSPSSVDSEFEMVDED